MRTEMFAYPPTVAFPQSQSLRRGRFAIAAGLRSRSAQECIATLGGMRGEIGERRFLVASSDYVIGRHGFVIDPVKHEPYD
jgi:hypothetical protein